MKAHIEDLLTKCLIDWPFVNSRSAFIKMHSVLCAVEFELAKNGENGMLTAVGLGK